MSLPPAPWAVHPLPDGSAVLVVDAQGHGVCEVPARVSFEEAPYAVGLRRRVFATEAALEVARLIVAAPALADVCRLLLRTSALDLLGVDRAALDALALLDPPSPAKET